MIRVLAKNDDSDMHTLLPQLKDSLITLSLAITEYFIFKYPNIAHNSTLRLDLHVMCAVNCITLHRHERRLESLGVQ